MSLQPIRNFAQAEMDNQRGQTDLELRLHVTHIPEMYWGMTWDDYDDDAHTSAIDGLMPETLKAILRDYVDVWESSKATGLVLLGPAGAGKSLGAALLAKALSDQGQWVKWSTYTELVTRRRDLISAEKEADRSSDWYEYNRAKTFLMFIEVECDVLVLDDVGKEYRAASGWSDAGLDALLRKRSDMGKATIITSNMLMEEWATYNSSMANFLQQVGEVVTITHSRDHRSDNTGKQRSARASRGNK